MTRGPSVGLTRLTRLTLSGFVALLAATGVALTVATSDARGSFDGLFLVIIVAFACVGVVVARNEPRNPIGWLLLGAAGLFAANGVTALYVVLDYRRHRGTLPWGHVALTLGPIWVPGIVLVGLAVLLFPEGRLPSARWRWPLRAYLVVGAWFPTAWGLGLATVRVGPTVRIDAAGNYTGTQHGLSATAGAAGWAVAPLLLLFWLTFVARQAANWRGADGERREQLKWLIAGGGISVGGIVAVVLTNGSPGANRIVTDCGALGISALPIGIGVGILKYRLYEIDRLISRTISYAILTGLLAGVFIGIVALATNVLPFSSPVAVAASTLAAAALFNPLRQRVQHLVDRRFNRARYDAEATIAAFTSRLRDAVDLETVEAILNDAVNQAVEPANLAVWIRSTASSR
jgi:hypothetical protein